MNQAAIIHRPTSDYIYPSSRNTLELQLITARADADEVELWYWMRYETDPAKIRRQRLHVSLQDALHDYYRTTVCTGQIAAYTRYCFHLKAGTDELWLGANGLQDTEPHMNGNFFEFLWPNPTDGFSAPAWRSRQVYYQIFPERFKNGDPSLTPPGAEDWGSAPTRENFMGGDLAGITQQLDYIQSLGVTCLYLTPIFRAPSNHKYDTADYFEIDPAFGTKEDLRRLVNQLGSRYGVGETAAGGYAGRYGDSYRTGNTTGAVQNREVGGSVGSAGAMAENRGAGNAEFPGNTGPAVRPVGRKKEKDEGIRRSERLLLTWLIEEPSLYARIKDIIGPEDFVKPLYKEAAKAVFEGLEAGNVNPAAILNRFIDDEGNYKEVAALFNASLEESLNNEEQKKAFAETVRRIKKNSLDDQIRRASDLNELQRLIREQAGLPSLVITLE